MPCAGRKSPGYDLNPERRENFCSAGFRRWKAPRIQPGVEEKKGMREAMIFLQQYGITMALSLKIYQKYGSDIYRVIRENPYQMADDITGVGFRIADEIARRAGIHTYSDFRIKSGIFYKLQQSTGEGHVYLPKE